MLASARVRLSAVAGIFLLTILAGVNLNGAGDIYVDASAPGANNGTSWADAFTDLQSAMAAASSGDTVRVAEGTYKPTSPSDPADPRTATFQLEPGVTLEGGYPVGGGDTRDPANQTILSGDIGIEGDNTDNAYHVVTAVLYTYDSTSGWVEYSAGLDGFTITGGNANNWDDYYMTQGGGIYVEYGRPTLTNVTFSDNHAQGSGGGACFDGGTPTITNVTFSGNSASQGGGMYSGGGTPTLTNVTFSGNSAVGPGGGIYLNAGHPTLIHVTFTGNTAGYSFGAIAGEKDVDGHPYVIRNSILWGNSPAGLLRSVTIENSVVEGGCPVDDEYFQCTNIITDDPKLDPQGLRDNGGYTQTVALLAGSSAIDTGADCSANTECSVEGVLTDQRGVARPQGAGYDIGAYEYVDVTPPVLTVPAGVAAEATSSTGTPVTIGQATAVDDADRNPGITTNAPALFPLGTTTVTWTATDASGNVSTGTQKVTVVDTTPPTITAPASVTANATSPSGIPAAQVNLGAPIVSDIGDANPVVINNAPAVFPVGVTTVTWTATDHSGNTATATQTVTVRYVSPLTIVALTPAPASLWPPNHKMVGVIVAARTSGGVGTPTCRITNATSSEPDNGLGDGDTANDIGPRSGLGISLRAEHAGNGPGRIYTLTVGCSDTAGNSATKATTVSVPHDQGKK